MVAFGTGADAASRAKAGPETVNMATASAMRAQRFKVVIFDMSLSGAGTSRATVPIHTAAPCLFFQNFSLTPPDT
jgi:hypothetical protein